METLNKVQDNFYAEPSNTSAGRYLEVVTTYFADEMIGDDTYIAATLEVSRWLLGLPLLGADEDLPKVSSGHYSP